MRYIIVVGDLSSGLYFHGPFTSKETAIEWAKNHCGPRYFVEEIYPVGGEWP
jgi:hypothetical protein